jgi:hypothetical protein
MTICVNDLPVRYESKVWHIGTLDPRDKHCRGLSYEGTGLSVSVHPDEWEMIAKLGGLPWFELTRREGRFLDFHELSGEARLYIMRWGLANGWATVAQQYQVSAIDEELGERRSSLFASESEAREEYRELLEDPACEARFAEVNVIVGLPSMERRLGASLSHGGDALEYLITFWIEDNTPFDGVWWEDALQPEYLSAPRGVIFTKTLPMWTCRRL